MYTIKLLFLFLTSLPIFHCQNSDSLYFPEDDGTLISKDNIVKIPPNVNLTQLRGTAQYEHYVDQIISGGIAKLTLAINKAFILNRRNGIDNIVFGPVSIAGALALVLLGSNGKTFDEILSVMGIATGVDVHTKSLQVHEQFGRVLQKLQETSGFDANSQISFAGSVFVQNNFPIRSIYKKTAEDLYQSEVLNVDFQRNPTKAQQVINAWVSDRTKGKIREIIAETPTPSTRVIIASAMYFKALWEYPFFEGATMRRPFFMNGRKTPTDIEVMMMANGGEFPYFKDENLNCEIMGFPYKGNATTMYVVMPFNSNAQILGELEQRLTASDLERLAASTVTTRAVLLFPKMKIESTIDLKSSLERLGVKSLFKPSDANLALLSPGEGVSTSNSKIGPVENNPLVASSDNDPSIIIFNRLRDIVNCSNIFVPNNNISVCQDVVINENEKQEVHYKKIGNKIGRRIGNRINTGGSDNVDTIDNLRMIINQQSTDNSYQNPGLYADNIIHKVYMDITETGTEAAATTSISLSRDGSRVTFRVDVPFLFFIMHEETKTIMFWGSVNTPTPNFKKT